MQAITVREIAQAAGIGKGSIYYYFSSKEEILDALIERNYKKPLELAKNLATQKEIPPFTRMAMLFQACRSSSAEFIRQDASVSALETGTEWAFLHQIPELYGDGIKAGADIYHSAGHRGWRYHL